MFIKGGMMGQVIPKGLERMVQCNAQTHVVDVCQRADHDLRWSLTPICQNLLRGCCHHGRGDKCQ